MRGSGEIPKIPRVLSIAGSDSGGGAGIQADLKAFAACRVHGMTAITAITAQNTVGVDAIEAISPELILAQVRAVARDIGVDAVKVGMLGSTETIAAVAQALAELRAANPALPIVVDPVMISESGAALLEPQARHALITRILPIATVATPNLPEARALTGDDGGVEPAQLARDVQALGPRIVVVTGGHGQPPTDVFYDGERVLEIAGERYASDASHGSGCTHSSVLAARLAHGDDPLRAARAAKTAAAEAIRDGLRQIGQGPGPVSILTIPD
ncbi:MAG: bifunctional hydroxymethylpyrimidine kinase/phosphomethylpyrimidine kinase [Solirubrobacteraceae bacterium]